MIELLNTKYSRKEIEGRRRKISKLFRSRSENITSETINAISSADLELLFELYDQIFFDNWFQEVYQGKVKFSLSRRMTRSAGSTICPKNMGKIKPEDQVIEIRIGVDFFFHYQTLEGEKTVCGIKTTTALEGLQLVFEHELCHLIEFVHHHLSSCKGDRFKTMARNLFGHLESHHQLPTYRQIAREKFGLQVGDTVSFTYEGKRLKGIINNINKRATVLVRDKKGQMVDEEGNRYSKYYVPLTFLK